MGLRRYAFEFETARLRCAWWAAEAARIDVDLAEIVVDLLTPRTTAELPAAWHGDFTVERARRWIEERDAESTTLLVVDNASDEPIGLLILAELAIDEAKTELRVGYLLKEESSGKGLGTELLTGLAGWARQQTAIVALTAGVASSNRASQRVLKKSGFTIIDGHDDAEAMLFQADVSR